MNQDNNKRIAKNTIYLYFQLLIVTALSLYSARLVLRNLGVEDFGIYNVVGGIVTFMGFLTSSMSSATQRYLSYNLGESNPEKFKYTFSMLINVYLIFCGIVFVVLEIIGPIYISKYMNLPNGREHAAHWVFQFSLLSFLVSTISVPFKSSIVAYERMSTFAYINVIESVLHFIIVASLAIFLCDHLIIYGLLMCVMSLVITLISVFYCIKKLDYCKYVRYWNKVFFKELASYTGWNLFGSVTGVLNIEGQAIVLNFFFGPIINAAKAVADRVNGLISQFSQNFYMAVTPQIIKSYASGDLSYMRDLVLTSSRYSFLMLFALSLPLYVIMEPLLKVWLGSEQVSFEMIKFCQYTLVYALINILEQPITQAVRATGNIRNYQVSVGLITLSFIPFCIVIFLLGYPSYYSVLLLAFIYLVAHFVRLFFLTKIIKVSIRDYARDVLVPIIKTLVFVLIVYYLLFDIIGFGFAHWIIKGFASLIIVISLCYYIGLQTKERQFLMDAIVKKFNSGK